MSVIGIVRLAPGQVGFYDDLTRIHLTIASPEKAIVLGMNTTNIKRSVKSGRLLLISGNLDGEVVKAKAPVVEPIINTVKADKVKVEEPKKVEEPVKEKEVVTKAEEVTEDPVKETAEEIADTKEKVVEETEVVEETVVNDVAEEVVEAEATKKAPVKKASTAKKTNKK